MKKKEALNMYFSRFMEAYEKEKKVMEDFKRAANKDNWKGKRQMEQY